MKGVTGTAESVRQAGFAETSPTIAPFNRDMQRSWYLFPGSTSLSPGNCDLPVILSPAEKRLCQQNECSGDRTPRLLGVVTAYTDVTDLLSTCVGQCIAHSSLPSARA